MMNRCYLLVGLEWGRNRHLYLGRRKPIRIYTSLIRLYDQLELIFVVELSSQHLGWVVGCLSWIREFLQLRVDLSEKVLRPVLQVKLYRGVCLAVIEAFLSVRT